MKFFAHVGMPKTGSSSIQNTITKLEDEAYRYLPSMTPNQSSLCVLLFGNESNLRNYHKFKKVGQTVEELLELRKKWERKVQKAIDEARQKDQMVILSAEDITAPGMTAVRTNFHSFFAPQFDEIEIFAYARPPISFIQSVFQQRLQSGAFADGSFDLDKLWPQYQKRFGQFEDLFGRENVKLKTFERSNLYVGDVVLDFAKEAGIKINPDDIRQSNESLSMEATSLLFIQRRFGRGMDVGFADAFRVNKHFVNRLNEIGDSKPRFDASVLDPIIEQHRDDLDWIDERVGAPILDSQSDADFLIRSQDDLIEVAMQNRGILQKFGIGTPAGSVQELANQLDELLDMSQSAIDEQNAEKARRKESSKAQA